MILTDDCNLCCSYCRAKAFDSAGSHDDNPVAIDEDLPQEPSYTLQDLFAFLARDEAPVVTFYGGEPLLRPDLIRAVMDGAPRTRFMIQTNGLLLHTLGRDYLNRFATILVSLDGDEALTDAHRGAGTYRKVMQAVSTVRAGGYSGELIARMTVAEDTDIVGAVTHLCHNPGHSFTSIHWQLDANFTADFARRNFGAWVKKSYNPGIRELVRCWVRAMETTGSVPRWYPFLDTLDDLLHDRRSRLRCGAGHANYSIMTDGHIAPCPVMVGMKRHYLGHIRTADPATLGTVDVGGECRTCDIRGFCGGRCLYASIMEPWSWEGRALVCMTVRNLRDALLDALPRVKELIEDGRVSPSQFAHEKFNGCEIIP